MIDHVYRFSSHFDLTVRGVPRGGYMYIIRARDTSRIIRPDRDIADIAIRREMETNR